MISSNFQSLLEVTHPVLLALSAQAPASKSQVLNHAKVLALCLLIFTIPLAISFAFVEALKLDMWMMVIISSSILTSIQVIGKFYPLLSITVNIAVNAVSNLVLFSSIEEGG